MAEPNIYWAGTPNYTPGNYGIEALFPHWTCGGFDGSVATLQNPAREASAHYVIEGGRVAQLVNETDSAWHCGNYYYNMRAISYELVGWPGNPPSYDTLDTCARMMAQASRDYFDGAPLILGENVMLHKWVKDTDCPGETDIGWLVGKANEYLGNGGGIGGEEMYPVNLTAKGTPVFRMFNPNNGEHFYTINEGERDACVANGWTYEGVAWNCPTPEVPVYRMYASGGFHHFTASYDEAAFLAQNGWRCEIVPFFAANSGIEVYRLFNPNNADHLLTTSDSERNACVANGWADEGVAFHV